MYQDGQFSKCSQKWKFTSISPPPAWSKEIDENKELQPDFETSSSKQSGIFWLAEVCQVQDIKCSFITFGAIPHSPS